MRSMCLQCLFGELATAETQDLRNLRPNLRERALNPLSTPATVFCFDDEGIGQIIEEPLSVAAKRQNADN